MNIKSIFFSVVVIMLNFTAFPNLEWIDFT